MAAYCETGLQGKQINRKTASSYFPGCRVLTAGSPAPSCSKKNKNWRITQNETLADFSILAVIVCRINCVAYWLWNVQRVWLFSIFRDSRYHLCTGLNQVSLTWFSLPVRAYLFTVWMYCFLIRFFWRVMICVLWEVNIQQRSPRCPQPTSWLCTCSS